MMNNVNVEQYYRFFADLSEERSKGFKIYFIFNEGKKEVEAIPLKDNELTNYLLDNTRSKTLEEFCYLKRKEK